MSTWISKAVLASFLLSGCVVSDIGTGLTSNDNGGGQGEPPASIILAGLKVTGPSGFCPVQDSRQRVGEAEFAALAPCSGMPGPILATTIGEAGSSEGISLAASVLRPYFETVEGQSALRGAGNRDLISVHEVTDVSGAVVLRLTRESNGRSGDSWRALMQIDGRLITLSVRPRHGEAMSITEGQRLIGRFVRAMRGANLP
jgi:hypothetical protein